MFVYREQRNIYAITTIPYRFPSRSGYPRFSHHSDCKAAPTEP